MLELEQRASLGEIFDGARRGRQPTGATKEYLDHLGMDGNFVPLSMFAKGPRMEERAAATITGDTQGNQQAGRKGCISRQRVGFSEHRPTDCPSWHLFDSGYQHVGNGPFPGGWRGGCGVYRGVHSYDLNRVKVAGKRSDGSERTPPNSWNLNPALRDNLNEAVMSALDAANLNHATDGLLGYCRVDRPDRRRRSRGYLCRPLRFPL